jgi:DNA-binding NarL/FixJ family response regulator
MPRAGGRSAGSGSVRSTGAGAGPRRKNDAGGRVRGQPTPAVLICARRLCRDLLRVYLADALGIRVVAEGSDAGAAARPEVVAAAAIAVCCVESAEVSRRLHESFRRLPFVSVICGDRMPRAPGKWEEAGMWLVRCADGLPALTRGLERALRGRAQRGARPGEEGSLTGRQLEVVRRMVRGWTNGRIAQAMGLSTRTVERHRLNAMRRLGVHTTAQLIAEAARLRLIDLDAGGREPPQP